MKKLFACILVACMLVQPIVVLAVEALSEDFVTSVSPFVPASNNEPTTKELEGIIKIVKPKLDVPNACSEFSWHYSAPNYNRPATWNLAWFDKDYNEEVSVTCDNKGNITYYFFYNRAKEKDVNLPGFSKDELEKVATGFLAKLCPEAAKNMKIEASSCPSIYSGTFSYSYVRYENDIIVPDNTAMVQVDYVTGTPVSLRCSYDYNTEFESLPEVDEEKVKDILVDNQKMKLSYRLKSEYDEDGKLESRKAYLVYTPEINYLSVDAKTGKVYTERNTWTVDYTSGGTNGALKGESDSVGATPEEAPEYELTPEELAQLDVLEDLISRKEAIDAVLKNEKLYIDPAATAVEAQLRKVSVQPYILKHPEEETSDLYYWNIYFSAPYESSKENGHFNSYMSAVVDAQDGKLVSFRANVPGYSYYVNKYKTLDIPKLQYSEEEAEDVFVKFASELLPEKMEHARVSDVSDSVVLGYKNVTEFSKENPVYRVSDVNCVRVNEGVDFGYNNISGAVDRVTGKITNFHYTWYDDVVFESPKDAITPEEAYRVLLDSDGFGLNYEINSNYTYNKYLADSAKGTVDMDKLYETEIYSRLVYSGYNYASTTVAALTGNIIDWSGEPVTEDGGYNYSDISGHWAEKDIRTLVDLGFGFDGNEFKPNSDITIKEFLSLMHFLSKYAYDYTLDDADENDALTRTEAIKYIIASEGYYKIACMPNIFITDFADNSELKLEDVGFIAIARGLGLVQGDANRFRPYDNLTRAEAVTMAFNFIRIDEEK